MGAMTTFDDVSEAMQAIQWPTPHSANEASESWPRLERPLRLGVMASGQGSNFEALVRACRGGPLFADVVQLVVNNPACEARQRAERLGIPCLLHDHRDHPQRQELDHLVAASFAACGVDLVVMAGWMRIVTPVLIGAYPGRLVNIHPSLLPSFRGLDAVGQALAAGVTLTGCTAHLVEEVVDAGPILVQAAVPVLRSDDHGSLAARIQAQEHRILPYAVALAALRLDQAGAATPAIQG